jgi:hypothetical protein
MIRVRETAVRQAAAALGLPEPDGAAEAAAVVSALAGGWTEENAQDVTRRADPPEAASRAARRRWLRADRGPRAG